MSPGSATAVDTVRLWTRASWTTVTVADSWTSPCVAVTVTTASGAFAGTGRSTVTESWPSAKKTLAGTGREIGDDEESVTTRPPVGAGDVSITVAWTE